MFLSITENTAGYELREEESVKVRVGEYSVHEVST